MENERLETTDFGPPPTRQPELVEAVCWECGATGKCFEYIVCCTGTTFHVCEACEDRVRADAGDAACPQPPSP